LEPAAAVAGEVIRGDVQHIFAGRAELRARCAFPPDNEALFNWLRIILKLLILIQK